MDCEESREHEKVKKWEVLSQGIGELEKVILLIDFMISNNLAQLAGKRIRWKRLLPYVDFR